MNPMYDPGAPEGGYGGAGEAYLERTRAALRQPTKIDWGVIDDPTFVYERADPCRGQAYSDAIACVVFPTLRLGFLAQTLSLLMILAVYHGHGGHNAFTWDLYNFTERLRTSPTFTLTIVSLLCLYGVGVLCLLLFQAFITDNGKFSRGFRAGSKVFNCALTLDLVVVGFRLLAFVYGYHFMQSRWWLHYNQTKTDFSLFYFSALMHGIALILYGVSIFYMEAYHDEGTYEEFAWVLLGLFGLAGMSEILMVLTGWGACFTFIQVAATLIAMVWAFSFEPLLHYHSSALHDRNVNDDVLQHEEQQGYQGFEENTSMM